MDKLVKTIDTLSQTIDTLNTSLGTLSIYDIGVLSVQILILIVLFYTAFYIKHQLRIQSNVLQAQLLKDRITMGWLTDEPITEEHINNAKYLPKNFIPKKYKKNKNMLGKYLYLDQTYDYFLYVFTSSSMVGKDPLGTKWHEVWIKELVTDDMFNEIRELNKTSFEKFERFLEDIEKSINCS